MRTSLFSAAVVAALAVTAWNPSESKAQIVIYPQISGSPSTSYGYSYPTYASWYSYPTYSSYNWTTPYSSYYGSWSGYPSYGYYPTYSNYYGNNGRYWRGYHRGWRRW